MMTIIMCDRVIRQVIGTMWPILFSLVPLFCSYLSDAQIVSHELRRLSTSINQFGIDALRALDRIESPDRVIVFCPICLSSTFMMIMMGSSKYQVVSSLRHALYVWSMRPQEVNQGFKDLFEHIDLNHLQNTNPKLQHANAPRIEDPEQVNAIYTDNFDSGADTEFGSLSLPKLIHYKELKEKTMKTHLNPWRKAITKSNNSSATTGIIDKTYQRDLADFSQMNAFSAIYMQRGLTLNYNYNLLLRRYYKTNIHPVDFIHHGEETRSHINSLVAANTEGKIRDLVKRNLFDPLLPKPKIMMLCTFHFRGTLDIEIMGESTQASLGSTTKRYQRGNIYSNATQKNKDKPLQSGSFQNFIKTKAAPLKYNYIQLLDSTVVEIPFSNRILSLMLVMPMNQNSSDMVLTKINARVLNDILHSLVVKKISLQIPIIKFDRGPINIEGLLKEMNLENIFLGGLSYTTETGLNRLMRPTDILHETSIDIGTINPGTDQIEDRLKVGAHGDSASFPSSPRDDNPQNLSRVKLDKTFYYFVFDSINGLVLTMGRIRQ